MGIKVRKIVKNNNKEKDNNPNKFKLGRNLGTLLIFLGGILLILMCLIPINYINTWNKNDVVPYEGHLSEADLNGVKRMKASEFDLFDINFYCEKYDIDSNKASFRIEYSWTDKTSELATVLKPYNTTNNYTVKTYVCLAADWVGFTSYNSSVINSKFTKDSKVSKTTSVSGINTFPQKADTWPIKVKVDTPNAYLYIWFQYDKGGKTYSCPYILEYEYRDYHTDKTIGGIIA